MEIETVLAISAKRGIWESMTHRTKVPVENLGIINLSIANSAHERLKFYLILSSWYAAERQPATSDNPVIC
jgi:hypothetical protein